MDDCEWAFLPGKHPWPGPCPGQDGLAAMTEKVRAGFHPISIGWSHNHPVFNDKHKRDK